LTFLMSRWMSRFCFGSVCIRPLSLASSVRPKYARYIAQPIAESSHHNIRNRCPLWTQSKYGPIHAVARPRRLDSYSVQSENLFLTYSSRQKVDDFLNGIIGFAIRSF